MDVHALLHLLVALHVFSVCTSNDDICTNDGDCQLVNYTTAPSFCSSMRHLYNTTRFPTTLHETQEIAIAELQTFQSVTIYSSCSEVAINFLCLFYIPPCLSAGSNCVLVLRPCRSLCQEVNDCLLREYNHEFVVPEYLHCSNFDSSGLCWGPPTSRVILSNRTSDTTVLLLPSSDSTYTSKYMTLAIESAYITPSQSLELPLTSHQSLELPLTLHPSSSNSAYSVESSTLSYRTSARSIQEPTTSYSFTSRLHYRSSSGLQVISPTSSLPRTSKHRESTIVKSIIRPSQSMTNLEQSQGFIKTEAILSMVLCIGWIAVAFISCCM